MYAASVSCFQGWIVREVLESVHAYRHKRKEKTTKNMEQKEVL